MRFAVWVATTRQLSRNTQKKIAQNQRHHVWRLFDPDCPATASTLQRAARKFSLRSWIRSARLGLLNPGLYRRPRPFDVSSSRIVCVDDDSFMISTPLCRSRDIDSPIIMPDLVMVAEIGKRRMQASQKEDAEAAPSRRFYYETAPHHNHSLEA